MADASRRRSDLAWRQQLSSPRDDDDENAPCSAHVLLLQVVRVLVCLLPSGADSQPACCLMGAALQEEEQSALAMCSDSEPWPLIDAAGVVGLKKGPVEPLLAGMLC